MDLDDRSQPDSAKEDLLNFYKRRGNQMQHQKYRILHRWAHFALVSDKGVYEYRVQKNVIRWDKR